jgi:hypothetical protein
MHSQDVRKANVPGGHPESANDSTATGDWQFACDPMKQ